MGGVDGKRTARHSRAAIGCCSCAHLSACAGFDCCSCAARVQWWMLASHALRNLLQTRRVLLRR